MVCEMSETDATPAAGATGPSYAFPLRSPRDLAAYQASLDEGAAALRAWLPAGFAPKALLTLGSGLGQVAEAVRDAVLVPYGKVPHLAASTAPGHRGRFVAGTLGGCPVLCMQGRLHPYEGLSPLEVTRPLRLAARLGVTALIATNASGGIRADLRPGQVVAISDHINFTGANPLVGACPEGEPRFPDMTHAYSPRLRALAREAARQAPGSDPLAEGVYLGLTGPSFETPAEIRAFRTLGADLVGMSTVWEVIVAAALGIEVLGLSLVTNMAAGMLEAPISTEDINRAAAAGASDMGTIVEGVLASL